jgi:DNA processing protein
MQQNRLENWLAVLAHPGVGPIKFKDILQEYPELVDLPKFIRPDSNKIASSLRWLEQSREHNIITLIDPAYPPQLKKIHDPPPVLFVKGKLAALKTPQLAIVGSRNASAYGMQLAEDFASHFAKLGISVTSGLAVGIDAASHRGVLKVAHACTIAVVANGLDIVYPAAHKNLSEEVCAKGGAIVSENMPGTEPIAGLFPRRNRIISGLSLGVLVVEATCNSGSLITAKMALDQDREVFAIPGGIHNTKSKGCNQLIKQGAKLVGTAEDILEELGGLLKYAIRAKTPDCKQLVNNPISLSPDIENVLDRVGFEPTALEKIVFESGRELAFVSRALIGLELDGIISKVPGGYVKLVTCK